MFVVNLVLDYFFALALVLMHLAQAFTRLFPKTAYCKLGNRRTMEGRMLWDRLIVRL